MRNTLITGTLLALATTVTTMICARRNRQPAIAPTNATSHVLWGLEAGVQDDVSMRYTAVGFAINHAACVFWAALYERAFGKLAQRDRGIAFGAGTLVSAIAYVTDYHLVPRRLTPGYELRLPRKDLLPIYGVIAVVLPLRALLAVRREHPESLTAKPPKPRA